MQKISLLIDDDFINEFMESLPKDKIVVVDRSELPHDITPIAGMMIQGLPAAGGATINVYIKKVEGDKVTLDGNHRFASKNIDFEVKLLMIH